MKKFKKKHTKLPRKEVVMRLLAKDDPGGELLLKYNQTFERTPAIIPEPIRTVCLAEFDPCRRLNIRYYPDLHNFRLYDQPNRSLPVEVFLNTFRQFIDPTIAEKLLHDLTAYRLEFLTTAEEWCNAYLDQSGGVKTCMTNSPLARCYVHPQNNLALAVLYAPGTSSVVARTIVNVYEKWYIRLFGDELLVKKLQEQGYYKLDGAPSEFRMYGEVGAVWRPGDVVRIPYFDFPCISNHPIADTHNPDTGLIDIIINEGFTR